MFVRLLFLSSNLTAIRVPAAPACIICMLFLISFSATVHQLLYCPFLPLRPSFFFFFVLFFFLFFLFEALVISRVSCRSGKQATELAKLALVAETFEKELLTGGPCCSRCFSRQACLFTGQVGRQGSPTSQSYTFAAADLPFRPSIAWGCASSLHLVMPLKLQSESQLPATPAPFLTKGSVCSFVGSFSSSFFDSLAILFLAILCLWGADRLWLHQDSGSVVLRRAPKTRYPTPSHPYYPKSKRSDTVLFHVAALPWHLLTRKGADKMGWARKTSTQEASHPSWHCTYWVNASAEPYRAYTLRKDTHAAPSLFPSLLFRFILVPVKRH